MTSPRLLIARPRALRDILDAATHDPGDEARWARAIAQTVAAAMPSAVGVGVQRFEYDATFRVRAASHQGVGVIASLDDGQTLRFAREAPVRQLHALWASRVVATVLPPELTNGVDGVRHAVTVVSQPQPGHAVVLVLKLEHAPTLSPHEQQSFALLRRSLEAGADALRNRVVLGTWSPDAVALDGVMAGSALWAGVTSGRYRLQTIGSGPLRHVRALENPPHLWAARRLPERETRVLELSARGVTGKQQSWELGVSPSVVSRLLMHATTRIGFVHPGDAIRFLGGLLHRPRLMPALLTPAEQDIFQLVRAGLSNLEIAQRRGRSVRTVANQVAAVLRKAGAPSRRALFPVMLETEPEQH